MKAVAGLDVRRHKGESTTVSGSHELHGTFVFMLDYFTEIILLGTIYTLFNYSCMNTSRLVSCNAKIGEEII